MSISRLIASAQEEVRSWIEQAVADNGCGIPGGAEENTDSPIEAMLLVAIAFHCRLWGKPLLVSPKAPFSGPDDTFYDHLEGRTDILIVPQLRIEQYRADFALFARDQRSVKVVVECDGHDFHERTKEQAQRDKARDRFLQSLGYKVLRFTGSEIYRDPLKCGREVIEAIDTAVLDAMLGSR